MIHRITRDDTTLTIESRGDRFARSITVDITTDPAIIIAMIGANAGDTVSFHANGHSLPFVWDGKVIWTKYPVKPGTSRPFSFLRRLLTMFVAYR